METRNDTTVNLAAYLGRVGFDGEVRTDGRTLRSLHLAHATHIPFENIDPLLGRPVRMDLASVQAKLITARRGGYCFEQNTLFAAVLEQLGFPVTRLAARVHVGTDRLLPRTHKLLRVEADGKSWICDVGFGSWGLLEPIELVPPRRSGAQVSPPNAEGISVKRRCRPTPAARSSTSSVIGAPAQATTCCC